MSEDTCANAARSWQSVFLAMLPELEQQARRAMAKCPAQERDEARQAILSYAAVACALLVQLDKPHLAYPGALVSYGLKHHRAGRVIGARINSKDVGSKSCQRKRRCSTEPLEAWKEIAESRGATPAEIAALRIDFSDWLEGLSSRDQQL